MQLIWTDGHGSEGLEEVQSSKFEGRHTAQRRKDTKLCCVAARRFFMITAEGGCATNVEQPPSAVASIDKKQNVAATVEQSDMVFAG